MVVAPITFVRQPSVTPVGGFVPGPVEVLVQDKQGDPVAGATVALEPSSNPGGATLQGETAGTGPTGHATFPSLRLDRLGTGYRLRAAVGQVKSVASDRSTSSPWWSRRLPTTAPGPLRAAIATTNVISVPDTIAFSIATGPVMISPASALPALTDSVKIDATSQPGYAGSPIVRLDGDGAGTGANRLLVQASGVTVRGLVITRFAAAGVALDHATGVLVADNYIGTDGTTPLATKETASRLPTGPPTR